MKAKNVSLKEWKSSKIMIYETAGKLYIFRKLLFRRFIFKKFSFNRSKIKKIIVILWYKYSEISTWVCSWKNSRFSEKSQLFNSAESEKKLVANVFEKNLRFECKSQIWEKTQKLVWVWDCYWFGGTESWEKLSFSEKSQIWVNLSVGGPRPRSLPFFPCTSFTSMLWTMWTFTPYIVKVSNISYVFWSLQLVVFFRNIANKYSYVTATHKVWLVFRC